MLHQEPAKYCRKRIEGYSEISEHGSMTDVMYEDFLKLLEKNDNKCKLHFKWVILLLGTVVILGGLCFFAKKEYYLAVFSSSSSGSQIIEGGDTTNASVLSNYTDILRDHSKSIHERKKRNISNATDFEDVNRNSKLHDYFHNLSEQYAKFTSALDVFMKEFKTTYFSKDKSIRSVSTPDNNLNNPKTESSFVENVKTDDTVTAKSDNHKVGTEIGNYSVSDVKNSSYTLYEDVNITTPSVIKPTTSDKMEKGTEVNTDRNLNSSDTEETHLLEATMPDIGTPPVSTIIPTDTERQNQSKSDLSNRDVTLSYSKSIGNLGPSVNDKNTVGELEAKDSIIDEVTITTNTVENQQTDTSFADWTTTKFNAVSIDKEIGKSTDVDHDGEDSTKESHIMKISHEPTTEKSWNTENTSSTEIQPDFIEIYSATEENIEINATSTNEGKSKVTNETVIDFEGLLQQTYDLLRNKDVRETYLQNLPEDKKPDEILVKIRNILESRIALRRSSRNIDSSDMQWKLYCFHKVINTDGKTDTMIVNVPVNQSDLHNLPNIRYRRDKLPPFSAHSLHTHQFFDGSKENKTIENDIANFSLDDDPLEVFTLPANSSDNKETYYCTYTQGMKSINESEQADIVSASNSKSSLPNESIDWNEVGKVFCSSSEKLCANGEQCIASVKWCDGIINCVDRSDELSCSCKERINAGKICDGYFDCPDGADERGCFGCPENSFSCDDWGIWKPNATCVPISKRCDDHYDCLNQKDEKDCQLLADKIFSHETFLVSYTTGYLHRNWRGRWYPVCEDVNSYLSRKACQSELGIKNIRDVDVTAHPVIDYTGEFILVTRKSLSVVNECPLNKAIYVTCPAEYCGTRVPEDIEKDKYQYKRAIQYYDTNGIQYRYKRSSRNENGLQESQIKELLERLFKEENKSRTRRNEGRVVGGTVSGAGFWPWVVALYKNGIFHCGAVILDEVWIMTAAHCVQGYKENYFEIQAGILRRLSFSPMEQNRVVTHFIVHSNYSQEMQNDIALVRVEPPLKLNRWVRPICLPEARPPWGPSPGTKCTAVGWGATQEHGPDPDNMREVQVPILPSCKHEADRKGDEICAGFIVGGHDTCQGDSGGPLLCKIPMQQDRWYVAGIVSHGEGCGRPMEPGAYTRIALYLPWLVKYADDRSLSKAHPSKISCPGMRCRDGGRCIAKKHVCDNVIDCFNGEDEMNCSKWLAKSAMRESEQIPTVGRDEDSTEAKYITDDGNASSEEIQIVGLDDLKSRNKLLKNVTYTPGITNNSSVTDQFNEFNKVPSTFNITNSSQTTWNELKGVHDVNGTFNMTNNSLTTPVRFDVFNTNLLKNDPHIITLEGELRNAERFKCGIIEQILPKAWYCDGYVDCEDGTDEINCTCSDLLRTVNQSLICNGIVDCYDLSDEKNCTTTICTKDEFNCYKNHTCINITHQCDGKIDCPHGEDEENCFALSEGVNVTMDYFTTPKFVQKGLIKVNEKGIWKTYTSPKEMTMKIREDICNRLGFRRVETFNKFIQGDYDKKKGYNYSFELSCLSHYDEHLTLPWYANIYADGNLFCSGLLLTPEWIIIADYNCHKFHNPREHYMVAVLGGHRKIENLIQSFYEQIILIDYVYVDAKTNFTFLHLETSAQISKYVNALPSTLWTTPPRENATCLLIGGLKEPTTMPIKANRNCLIDKCQFEVSNKTQLCSHHHQNISYNFVVCLSPLNSWYLTAVVGSEISPYCSSNSSIIELPNWDEPVFSNYNDSITDFSPPNCTHGYRCKFGKCITWSEVCDGKTDCRNSEDESPERCASKKTYCHYNPLRCSCKTYEFKCENMKCVNKNLLCDGNDDCGDHSDEPVQCANFTCATYLNMTQPRKLCDSRKDCADKSDENLSVCPSYCNTTSSFKCTKSGQCIPLEFVCDGESDCSHHEDESECGKLRNDIKDVNEPNLFLRRYGKWFSDCLAADFTDFNPEAVCSMSHHKKVTKLRMIPGTKTPTVEYIKIRLFNNKDFHLISKPFVSNVTEACNYVHLECK